MKINRELKLQLKKNEMHGNKILGANGAFFWACEEQCIQSYDTLKKISSVIQLILHSPG